MCTMADQIVMHLEEAIRQCVQIHTLFPSESSFSDALRLHLGGTNRCERECPVEFGPAKYSPPAPPPELGFARDVCMAQGASRRLDLLYQHDAGLVAIELKHGLMPRWKGTIDGAPFSVPSTSDGVQTYHFLKDIHRLERLTAIRSNRFGRTTPIARLCVFLTNYPMDFEGKIIHSAIRLSDAALLPAGHVVQFNAETYNGRPTSKRTLWIDYAPFRLANSYTIAWTTLDRGRGMVCPEPGYRELPLYRVLLMRVLPISHKD
jgi:hypothetical protein